MLKNLSCALLLFVSSQVHADIFDDVLGVIKKQLLELEQQVKIQGSMDSRLKQQFDELTAQRKLLEDTMQGHYGYSNLHQSSALTDWQHSGKSIEDALNAMKGSDALSAQAKAIANKTPLHTADKVYPKGGKEKVELYNAMGKTALAARASQQLSYNKVDDELKMLEALQGEIEKSPNIKSSLDLIARLQIETAKLIAQQMKNNALQGELSALEAQKELGDDAWLSQFFKSTQ